MMSSASTRKRAEDFAAAVDGRSVSVLDETRTFLALVEQLRGLDTPRPDPDFALDLRARLLAAAPTELTSSPVDRRFTERRRSRPEPRRRRFMSVAASVCITAGTGMGAAAASQSALPGDAMYPVKRGIEQVELALAGSSAERGQEFLESADSRLTEIQGLALTRPDDLETPALIGHTLDEFSAQATDGAESLIRAYHRETSDQSIADLRKFTDESATKLDALGQAIPAEARSELLAAAKTLTSIDAAAREACPACSALTPLTLTGELSAFQREIGTAAPASPQPKPGSRINPAPSILPTDGAASPGGRQQPSRPPGDNAPTQAPSPLGKLPVISPAPTAVLPLPLPTAVVPPLLQPTADAPPAQQPTAGAPPLLQPTAAAPPLLQPTAAAPPLLQPTAAAPPLLQPTAGAPPVQQPTAGAPPVQQPTAGAPPVQQPTAVTPPIQQPTTVAPTTEFTAPTLTNAPSASVGGPTVPLPTGGLLDPSGAVPSVGDPIIPSITPPQLP